MSRRGLIVGTLLALVMAGLPLPSLSAPGAQAQEKRLHVVASTSILADVVRNVVGNANVEVVSLIPVGVNAHTYEPSAQDVATLSDADAVFVVGMNYEAGLMSIIKEAAGNRVVDVSTCVPIRPVSTEAEIPPAGVAPGQPGALDNTTIDARCEAHYLSAGYAFGFEPRHTAGLLYEPTCSTDEHAPGGACDPHVWTDPVNVALWTYMIRDTLLNLVGSPYNKSFAANADTYDYQLAGLHHDVQALMDSLAPDHRTLVTNHETLNYLAARYGLTVVGVVIPGGSTTSEPSVQEVLALTETIKKHHVPAIFTENVVSDSLAQQVASETGAAIVRLYTESLSQPSEGADTYLNYMRYNASAIAEAMR